jgi:glycine C-acetyltransferase
MAFSLADFYFDDGPDPLTISEEFTAWRRKEDWALRLYERQLLGAPAPRARLEMAGAAREVINLSSYNYLGLATEPRVVQAAREALETYGTGACGSPALSGMTDQHRLLETELSEFLGREATLLFSSGFGGALGAIAGLLHRGDVALLDDRAHQSLMDGARMSQAAIKTFSHNDPAALEEALTASAGKRRLIAVEGVYSMDGDVGALPDLLDVAERHKVGVMVDEAHSILTAGPSGGGVVEQFGVQRRVALVYGTLSKAFAGIGGFVSGDASIIDYLRCFAHTYGFSCALPPAVVAGLRAGLRVAREEPQRRQRLCENAEYFRGALNGAGLNTGGSTSQVVPIIIGPHRRLLYELCNTLLERGVYLPPIDYPSVPEEEVRLRAAITASHTRADLDEAVDIIVDTVKAGLRDAA